MILNAIDQGIVLTAALGTLRDLIGDVQRLSRGAIVRYCTAHGLRFRGAARQFDGLNSTTLHIGSRQVVVSRGSFVVSHVRVESHLSTLLSTPIE